MEATDANDDDELYPEETVLDDVDAVIELFEVRPKRLREALRRALVRIVEEDEDDTGLAATLSEIYRKLSERNQVRLIDLACGYWPAGPLVCGAMLREVLGDREKIDLLFKHAGDDILRWFRRVPLSTLMSEDERRALETLPSVVEAYHETTGHGARLSLGPFWSLRPDGTAAPPVSGGEQTRLVRAQVPRSSVLAYSRSGKMPTLIVDFRRVGSVEVVGKDG